jgi:hypothetical protein
MLSDRALAAMPLFTSAIAVAIIVGLLALAGCGGGDDDNSTFDLTPEQVQAKLQERGFATGEIITDGANVGVAKGGKLDANAYLGVESTPEGEPLYVGIYFFDSPEDATALAKERTEDRDFHTEVIGNMELEIAGRSGDLFRVIAAVQAPD